MQIYRNNAARTPACPSFLPNSAVAGATGQGPDHGALLDPTHAQAQQQADEGGQASKRQAAETAQQKGKRARVDEQLSSSKHVQPPILQEQDIGWDDETETSGRGDEGKASAADSPAGIPPLDMPISRPKEDYSPSSSLGVHAFAAIVHADADAVAAEPLGRNEHKEGQPEASDVRRAVLRFVRAILDPLHQCKVRLHCWD